MTIRDVLKSAFSWLYELEERMNTICDSMGDASEDELNQMMEELGVIQEMMDAHDFYILDSRIEEIGRALGLDCLKSPIFCFWMSRPTTWMWNISPG